jgi:methyl-accepting chemotaxis protein
MADLQRVNGQTHEEVFAIGGLLRELSNLLQNLTSTFDEFTARTTRIAELATHVPVAMVELTEAARHDNAMIGNISQQITDLDT